MQKIREIYHKPCAKCESTGFLATKSRRKCSTCDSQGWLTVDGKDVVCPSCNGDGKTTHFNERECSECKGKGNFPQVVEEVSIEYDDCNSCNGFGKFYSWECSSRFCNGDDTYDDWDGKHCKICDCSCIVVTTNCCECDGRKQRVWRLLKDIKTGEEHEVEEWALKEEDDEENADDE